MCHTTKKPPKSPPINRFRLKLNQYIAMMSIIKTSMPMENVISQAGIFGSDLQSSSNTLPTVILITCNNIIITTIEYKKFPV